MIAENAKVKKIPKGNSLISRVMIPMLILGLLEIIIFAAVMIFSGELSYIKKYSYSLLTEKTEYLFPAEGSTQQKHPTVIVGMGPAGLFCGYYLASTAMHLSFWNGVQTWMPDRRM